ncbi:UDP-3-O-(3-hydroxymyristoyl) N-acetylglucosamine deacetylase [Desulfocurvibacter africanus PCS]|uniref:UDP-3-O-acyl-N-acetylglucosamine deacetylase n=1 Tax=Desulfocurvibacter africanus PCS TaxID=1262666 RepID=M5Q141_DESAF|nr:UDP-3-O-acyl-N-acetylglucosamine deacetylase [Desulfocurvibacter africanus]EMG36223.1 UDP-3-O-(3-hydroxymyristoyl) N-acetylglucosamine deacetylase [Desulfocurvibacter africanus PCS]
MLQKTIHKSVACSGIGLHSGKKVRLVLRPAGENTGILFALQNGSGRRFLTPRPESVIATGLATTLGQGGDSLSTVEHLMAAVRGLGIDNILVDVEGGEIPIMDGSAASFVYLLRMAGERTLSARRKVYRVTKPVEFKREGKLIRAEPCDGFHVDYTIDFPHPLIGRQSLAMQVTPQSFTTMLAKARTFGFLREVEYLRKNGLALGGSLDNAVVLDDYGVVNTEGLRFSDEFVRHKILDFVGDMAVLDAPLWGSFTVFASGHALNNAFLRHLWVNADEYLEEVSLGLEPVAGLEAEPDMVTASAAVLA